MEMYTQDVEILAMCNWKYRIDLHESRVDRGEMIASVQPKGLSAYDFKIKVELLKIIIWLS